MKLSLSQQRLLLWLAGAAAEMNFTRRVRRRGPLASASVLRALGLVEYIGPGVFNGEYYHLTAAGRAMAGSLKEGR